MSLWKLLWQGAQGGNNPAPPTGGTSYEDSVIALAPTAYWRLGDSTANPVDSSGNARHLDDDSTLIKGADGWAGDGSDAMTWAGSGDYAFHVDHADWDVGLSDYSIAFCLKRSGTPVAEEAIIGHDLNGIGGEWGVNLDTVSSRIVVKCNANFLLSHSVSSTIYDNSFHHIVITFDRDGLATMYYEGVSVGTVSIAAQSATALDNTGTMWVGARGATSWNLNGSLCEVAFWKSRLLTSGEVAALYAARYGSGSPPASQTYADVIATLSPVAYYPLGESAGTVASDLSPTANHGTYNGAPTLGVTGPIAGITAVTFDGATEWMQAPYTTALNFAGTADFSIVLWLKMTAWPSTEQYILGRTGDGYVDDYYITPFTNDVLRMRFNDTATPATGVWAASDGAVNLDDSAWHMVAICADRAGNAIWYVDGASHGTTSVAAYQVPFTRVTPLYLARRVTAGYWAGSLAHVSIHSIQLQAADITALRVAAGY